MDENNKAQLSFDTERKRVQIALAKVLEFVSIGSLVVTSGKFPLRSKKFWLCAGTAGIISGTSEYWAEHLKEEIKQNVRNR